jgi:pullulanase
MSKILLMLFLWLFPLVSPISSAESKPVSEVYIHYYRYQADYSPWDLWVWQNQPAAQEGSGYAFVKDETATNVNFGGVVSKISLTGLLAGATRIGFIVRKPDWSSKDVEIDRFIDIPSTIDQGVLHVYLVEGDARVGIGINDINGPDKNPKFRVAYFQEMNKIYFSATEALSAEKITLSANGEPLNIKSYQANGTNGVIEIDTTLDFSKKYEIKAVFSNNFQNKLSLTYDGVYDSQAFEEAFGYMGNDLGAIADDSKTTFRVWAPISEKVILNIYDTGTPASLGGSDVKSATYEMIRSEKGTFYFELPINLHGKYYTYSVTNGTVTNEVIDPYAKSSGVNGVRGLVVDFSKTNPTGFIYGNRPSNMSSQTDAIIYELHVRDLTIHESWNGSPINRGRYLGLVESGTKYNGVTTGFDHIKELGVTHVQLLPFFDFGVLDESRINQPGYNSFNWGYMPINFNVLEGSYSKDPFDGLSRIVEMKTAIREFTNNNIRINMDVVYNHTGLTADSNFNLIVPGYYFRKNPNGSFSNGSGTGNETASERFMMRKFMVDSLVFWTTEYNISGYRFDLMALHDLGTMLQIEETLKAIDTTIMIYGEPWMGGTSPLPAEQQAGKRNIDKLGTIGAFNDDFRDAVKGSVFNKEDIGFIQGNFDAQLINRIKYGITGGVKDFIGINPLGLSTSKQWHVSPDKIVNYITAHDNNTLHDKLYLSLETEGNFEIIPRLIRQGNAMVLTSQGIAFIHAGDEFMRSKPAANGRGFDHNSYESPDSVNQLRWDLKAREEEMIVFEYFKGLISLRKNHPSFRMTDNDSIKENLKFVYEDIRGIIAFELSNNASNDEKERIMVIHNANRETTRLKLPTNGGWVVIADGDKVDTSGLTRLLGGSTVNLSPNSSYIMYQDKTIADRNYTNEIIALLSIIGGLIVWGFLMLRSKKKEAI